MLQRAVLAEIATNWVSLSTPLGNAGLKCSVTDTSGRGSPRACCDGRARAGVLQTSQKWPEIAGSKYSELAKPGEKFQRLSPKAVVLPLHHSPMIAQRHQYVRSRLGKCSRPNSGNPANWRPSTRYLPLLASASGWRCCRGARQIQGHLRRLRRSQGRGV